MNDPNMSNEDALKSTGEMAEQYLDAVQEFQETQENLNIQRAGHTVEDWNILKLKNGEAVVSLAGEDPFLFTMPLYR